MERILPQLRDALQRGAEHLKQAIDCGVTAACLLPEDRANDQADDRATMPAQGDEPLMTVEDLSAYLNLKAQTLRD